MIEKTNTRRVLELFLVNPTAKFHLREIARVLAISLPTVIFAVKRIEKFGFVAVHKGKVVTEVAANAESEEFVHEKRVFNLDSIYHSGIVGYLNREYGGPQTIILFGSYSRGEDIEDSDIDIAVITKQKRKVELNKYEKLLRRKITVHEVSLGKVSEEFRFNLYNGIVLSGAL